MPGSGVGAFQHDGAAGTDRPEIGRQLLGAPAEGGDLLAGVHEVEGLRFQAGGEEVVLSQREAVPALRSGRPAGTRSNSWQLSSSLRRHRTIAPGNRRIRAFLNGGRAVPPKPPVTNEGQGPFTTNLNFIQYLH